MPSLYEKGNAFMWDDPHISKQLLNVHLNKDIDLASRKQSSINSTIDWILQQCPQNGMSILDLGCGPGLYCDILHDKGHSVTGVDISGSSIEYAKAKAIESSKSIEYVKANYLNVDLESNKYDLVIMIYTDFGVLSPNEQKGLLLKVHKSLKPGGIFIFDVLNDTDLDSKLTPVNWEVAESGFWSDKPYLVLSNSFLYEEQKTILYQHNVMTGEDELKTYRFWTQHFSKDDIIDIVADTKFTLSNTETNVLPESDLWGGRFVDFYVLLK
ncbi:class I SAM-dependent methyltransferase [[Muricauda] lutisoli]|uniref:Class I SAM-dependent methyltransferase n=1 Tax=[Muricauda] lutisoli TaxID=2816035 RepID=A0ABS3EU98_9FLAO|nr:class I SAM-dependent methyltransferase [[Muricauda] lutisoli]MBO0329825.1 class I SAM-dependent methyltransferase [[Muricauda] lutisoli]